MSHNPFSQAASVALGKPRLALLIVMSLLLCGCVPESEPAPVPPNILLAIADDWGFPMRERMGIRW